MICLWPAGSAIAGTQLTLVEGGVGRATIEVAAQASPSAKLAARECSMTKEPCAPPMIFWNGSAG